MTPFAIWGPVPDGGVPNLNEAFTEAISEGVSAARADAGVVFLREGEGWVVKSVFDYSDTSGRMLNPEERSFAEELAQSNGTRVLEDIRGTLLAQRLLLDPKTEAALMVPLKESESVVGFLALAYWKAPHTFTTNEIEAANETGALLSSTVVTTHMVEAARKERLQLQTIMDNTPAGMAIIDGKEMKVKWCNKAFRNQLEEPYLGVDVQGLPLKECIPNFRGSRLETILEEVLRNRKKHTEPQLEIKGTVQGSTFWRLSILPFGSEGRYSDVLMLMIETTEQVKAIRGIEHLLKREEEERLRLRVILDTLPVGVVVSDVKGGFIEVNHMFNKIWGGEVPLCNKVADYSIYTGKWTSSQEKLKPQEWAIAKALAIGGDVLGDVVDIRRFDGKDATVLNSASPIKSSDGKVIGAVQVTQDITDRRLMETELETARSVLEAVIDQMPAGIAVADAPKGNLIFGNTELDKMFGWPQEASGTPLDYTHWQVMHPDGKPIKPEEHAINRSIQKGEVVKGMEMLLRRADGSMAAVNVNSSPIRNKRGKITGGVVINVDITDKKKTEKELEARARELERSNADLEQFAYAASHDIKEPLRAISGYLNLLEMKYADKLDDEGKRFVEASIAGAERLNRLTDDLLAYSRIGSKGMPFLLTDFEHALNSTLGGLREAIAENEAVITHDPLPSAVADESQIMELFQNLLVNAIKYRSATPPRIHISSELSGGKYIFSVKDNGIGVPKEDQEKIWRMFYRVHSKKESPGTGMGLSICKRIVERHGGKIWMEDNPTGGSVFKFTIPVKWSERTPRAAPAVQEKNRIGDPPARLG